MATSCSSNPAAPSSSPSSPASHRTLLDRTARRSIPTCSRVLRASVANRFEEIAVAPNTAAIFWRAGSFTFQAEAGTSWPWDRRRTALEQDLVFPAVAEVVLVLEGEAFAGLGQDLAEIGLRRIDALEVPKSVVEQFGIAVSVALDRRTGADGSWSSPSPSGCVRGLVERAVLHLDSSPDRWLGTEQRDLELEEGFVVFGFHLTESFGWL